MAGYLNKAMIIGNLGRAPELRRTTGGNPVTDFSIATTERYTDKQGQRQEQTEWHNIVVWGKLAEIAAQYLKKGSSVYVEGKIQTRSWENNGQKQYKTEIVASNFQMLDRMQGDQQQSGGFSGGSNFNDNSSQGFGGQQQGGSFGGQQQQSQPSQQGGGFGGGQQQQSPQGGSFGGGQQQQSQQGGGFGDSSFGGGSAPMPSQPQQPQAPQAPAGLPVEDELPF